MEDKKQWAKCIHSPLTAFTINYPVGQLHLIPTTHCPFTTTTKMSEPCTVCKKEADVYKLLIDTYRLRMEDQYTFEGEVDSDCIYGGAPGSLMGFRRFLKKAEAKSGLLPPWWSAQRSIECQYAGLTEDGWSLLTCYQGERELAIYINKHLKYEAYIRQPSGYVSNLLSHVT